VDEASLARDLDEDGAVERAKQTSKAEALQQENADVSHAILQSKMESPCGVECVVLHLTHHTESIRADLAGSPLLAECCARVSEAGCQVMPEWAHGALFFAPCTEEGVEELGIELKPHHVIALAIDMALIREALSQFPRRRRPQCKVDIGVYSDAREFALVSGEQAGGRCQQPAPDLSATRSEFLRAEFALLFTVERTFVHVPSRQSVPDDTTLVCSAPCGDGISSLSPRRIISKFESV